MQKTVNFKKKIIASAIASIAGLSSFAFAQEEGEEIIITGIKASLQRAQDIKRDAVGVVDAISAEDLGKMPDSNISESLQRITGISIDRNNGEGARVTIRGLGPELNMVTLNGRVMPTSGYSRAYEFGNIASEAVNGAEVYKTGRSSLATGGLGGTINLKTLRPFDIDGTKATFGVKGVKDESINIENDGDAITPEASGLYSWTNEDKTFGVALSGSYQKRDSSLNAAFVSGWDKKTYPKTGTPHTIGAKIVNAPAAEEKYYAPTEMKYQVTNSSRVRENAQLTMQFRPIDKLTATFDYTTAGSDWTNKAHSFSTWFNEERIVDIEYSKEKIKTPLYQRLVYPHGDNKDLTNRQDEGEGYFHNNSAGVNLKFDATDDLSFALDFHNSHASGQNKSGGIGISAMTVITEFTDFRAALPIIATTHNDMQKGDFVVDQFGKNVLDKNGNPIEGKGYANGNANGVVDAGDVAPQYGSAGFGRSDATVQQLQLSAAYNLGDFAFFTESAVNVGIETRENISHNLGGGNDIQMGDWSGVDPKYLPDQYISTRDFGKSFPDFSATTNHPEFTHTGFQAKMSDLISVVENLHAKALANPKDLVLQRFNAGLDKAYFPNGKFQWDGIVDNDLQIEEKVQGAYLEFKTKLDIADMPANLVAGAHYEKTEVTSRAFQKLPTAVEQTDKNDYRLVQSPLVVNFARTGDYAKVLPSVDFDIAPLDNVKVRTSIGKTIGRASFYDLRPTIDVGNLNERTGGGGNPDLDPMESTNFDISAEWYYDDASYVSVGYFQKDVKGFIGTAPVQKNLFGLRDLRKGPRADAARAKIIARGETVGDVSLFNQMIKDMGLDPAIPENDLYPQADDPLMIFTFTQPTNAKQAKITGEELAVQHMFGETGFGVQANYTIVSSDTHFDNNSMETQFAINGLSDTANLVAFFDKYGFQGRIALNWRDQYLTDNFPTYVKARTQLDFSTSYAFNDQLSVSFEGINVTGANRETFKRYPVMFGDVQDQGARYVLGARYSF